MKRRLEPKEPLGMAGYASFLSQGLPEEEHTRPLVAILACSHPLNPGNQGVEVWANKAAFGAQAAGANPVILRFPSPLVSTEFSGQPLWLNEGALARQVELQLRELAADSVVVVADCEISAVATLRGVARVDLPVVVVPGDGLAFESSWEDLMAFGANYVKGQIARNEWKAKLEFELAGHAFGGRINYPSYFKFLLEVLGLSLPGSTTLEAGSSAKNSLARQSGWEAVVQHNTGQRLSRLLNPASIRNALALDRSLGGSILGIWNLVKIVGELGVALNKHWLEQAKPVSFLKVGSERELSLREWHGDGGVLSLLYLMWEAGAIDASTRLANRHSLKEAFAELDFPEQPKAFQLDAKLPETKVFYAEGSCAPQGMLIKAPLSSTRFEGYARVFDSENEACKSLQKAHWGESDILVYRNAGSRAIALGAFLRSSQLKLTILSDCLIDGLPSQVLGFKLPSANSRWEELKTGTKISLQLNRGVIETEGTGVANPAKRDQDAELEWARLSRFCFHS